jgi:hypothetical protein
MITPLRLQEISFIFPNTEAESRAFFGTLVQLLGDLPQADVLDDYLHLSPTRPVGALPTTSFQSADVPIPQIVFAPAPQLNLTAGGIHLGVGNPPRPVPTAGDSTLAYLTVPEMAQRLRGHVTRLDHTGVNLPARLVERVRWDELLGQCAASAALYRYPGEDWPFILPSTEEEFNGDIHQFVVGREPKFEFVYDTWMTVPVLQFSLGTDLPRTEIEVRFPVPEGVALSGLEDVFRTVYVRHPWAQLVIRFDLNYQGEEAVSDWDTGEWLVLQGGRIRS